MKKTDTVAKTYSYLWNKEKESRILPDSHHYDKLQEIVPFSIVEGNLGIDAGCGNGYDLRLMALKYPDVKFVGLDVSDGIYNARKNCEGLRNVYFVKGSLLDMPFKGKVFDFAYSFGVIHHTSEPSRCIVELERVLSEKSVLTVYLYEEHNDNPVKYYPLILIRFIRRLSARLPKRLLYFLCVLLSPFIFITFSIPAKILSFFKRTKRFSDKIPFNFAKGPFSVVGDLYDRFGAPIEHRYSREGVMNLFNEAAFKDVQVVKLQDTAGWVGWGRSS